MTEAFVEIPSGKWETQRKLDLPKSLREAISDLLRRQWPQHTAKYAARSYSLSLDRAREAVAGRASLSTFEAMIQKGRLAVALPVMEAVSGQKLATFLRELREAHEDDGRRLAALFGDTAGAGRPDPRGSGRDPGLGADQARPAASGMGGAASEDRALADGPPSLDLFDEARP